MGTLTKRERPKTDDLVYVCRGCGEAFTLEYHVCPECGGYSVERTQGGRLNGSAGEDGTRFAQWLAALKRRFTVNRTFDESNTARVRK